MSRATPYQSKPSVEWLQSYATLTDTRLYLISRSGPSVFKINDESDRSYKVILVRVAKEHPLAYQTSFTDTELNQILSGQCSTMGRRNPVAVRATRRGSQEAAGSQDAASSSSTGGEAEAVEGLVKRQPLSEVEDENLCPICQDEMNLEKQALTWCRRKCGNNMHAKCMLIFAQHKESSNRGVECPLCREPYDMEALKRDNKTHQNIAMIRCTSITCSFCKCLQRRLFHRCIECSQRAYFASTSSTSTEKFVDFCGECFTSGRLNERHREHHFLTSDASIENANEVSWATAKNPLSRAHPSIDPRTLQHMQQRELNVQDYELLLSLDRKDGGDLSVVLVSSLPLVSEAMIRTNPSLYGRKCVCNSDTATAGGGLEGTGTVPQNDEDSTLYCQLPCQHILHKKCLKSDIDTILLDEISNLCKYRCSHEQCGKVVFVCLKRKLNRPKKEGEEKNSSVVNASVVSTSQYMASSLLAMSTALRNQATGNSSTMMGLGIAGTAVEGLSGTSVSVSTNGRVRNLNNNNNESVVQVPVPSIPQPRRLHGPNGSGIGGGQTRRFSEDTSAYTRPPPGLNLASDRHAVANVGRQLATMVQQEFQGGIAVGGVGIAGVPNSVEAEYSMATSSRGNKSLTNKRAPIGRLRSLTANSVIRDNDVNVALGLDSTTLNVGRVQSSNSQPTNSLLETNNHEVTNLRLNRSSSARSGLLVTQNTSSSDPLLHSARSVRSNHPPVVTADLELSVGNASSSGLPLQRNASKTKAVAGNIIRSNSRPKRNPTVSQDNIADTQLDALLNVHHY